MNLPFTSCRICHAKIPAKQPSDHFELTYCKKCEPVDEDIQNRVTIYLNEPYGTPICVELSEKQRKEIINIIKKTK